MGVNMDTGLNNAVVLVTGGAGGIGQAICKKFALEGASVIVHYHNSSEEAISLAEGIGGIAIKADLRNPDEAFVMFDEIVAKYSKIDVCIANAGYYPPDPKPLWEINPERWNNTIASNLSVTYNTSRAFLKNIEITKRGSLVLVGSTAGIHGESGHSDYAAAKGAITSGLLLSLKNDVARIGDVRVNAVAPGWTLTPKKLEQGIDKNTIDIATATMALKKLATPEDIANIVISLSSDLISGHITGQVIEVAGGMEGRLIYS